MNRVLKLFTKREWALLIVSISLILLSFFLSPVFGADRSVLALLTSVIGVFGVIFMARGAVLAHRIYIVFSILYVFVAISSKYYGEAIIYCALMLPIHIFSIISWKKHLNDGETVQIRGSGGKEFWLLVLVGAALTVPIYFLLRRLNTQNLIIGTLSFTMSFVAAILMLRRNKYYAVAFAIDDLVSIMLWGIHIFQGTYRYIPTLITVLVTTTNDIYSFTCWMIRARRQKEDTKNGDHTND